jgi:hypothetical protein
MLLIERTELLKELFSNRGFKACFPNIDQDVQGVRKIRIVDMSKRMLANLLFSDLPVPDFKQPLVGFVDDVGITQWRISSLLFISERGERFGGDKQD